MKKDLTVFILLLLFFYGCSKRSDNNSTPKTYTVSTYAGTGTSGLKDGPALSANFQQPLGITINASGELFITDGNVIRKITSGGIVSTYAGDGQTGNQDGPASTAAFSGPVGITLDKSGNLFVADYYDNLIRMISPDGTVSTVAGSGILGYKDGAALSANFAYPFGIINDQSGNLYISEVLNNVIRKLTTSGIVSTYAGNAVHGLKNGAALSANFSWPSGMAFDGAGNLYIADATNYVIRKITPAGIVSTYAGSGLPGLQDGNAVSAKFNGPTGLAFDESGNLYVVDEFNQSIRKITPAGEVSTIAGTGTEGNKDGPGISASFENPIGIVIDASGNIFVTDSGNSKIRKISSN